MIWIQNPLFVVVVVGDFLWFGVFVNLLDARGVQMGVVFGLLFVFFGVAAILFARVLSIVGILYAQ